MKKITFISFIVSILLCQFSFAQTNGLWIIKKESELKTNFSKLNLEKLPKKYKFFQLDVMALKNILSNSTVRKNDNTITNAPIVSFPFENGASEDFKIEKINVLHPDLGAKYPEIQSYTGRSTKNPLNVIYFTMFNNEFHGLITGEKTIYIDPYSKNDFENYIVYDRSDLDRKSDDEFVCYTKDEDLNISINEETMPKYKCQLFLLLQQ